MAARRRRAKKKVVGSSSRGTQAPGQGSRRGRGKSPLDAAFVVALDRLVRLSHAARDPRLKKGQGRYQLAARALEAVGRAKGRPLDIRPQTVASWHRRGLSKQLLGNQQLLSNVLSDLYAAVKAAGATPADREVRDQVLATADIEAAARRQLAFELGDLVRRLTAAKLSRLRLRLPSGQDVRGLWGWLSAVVRTEQASAGHLSRWARAGSVPAHALPDVQAAWDHRKLLTGAEVEAEALGLVALARIETTGADGKPEETLYRFRNEERSFRTDERSGYFWYRRIDAFSSPETIGKMVRITEGLRVPRGYRWDRWNLRIVCAVYWAEQAPEPPYDRQAPPYPPGTAGKATKYPSEITRQFGRELGATPKQTRQESRRFVYQVPRAGGIARTLPKALELFKKRMLGQLSLDAVTYVQGFIVQTWRDLSPAEQEAHRQARQEAVVERREVRKEERIAEKKRLGIPLRREPRPRIYDVLEDLPPSALMPRRGRKKKER